MLGDRASLRQARRLAGLDAEPAEQAADALAAARILAPGEPLSFTHPLIATSVLADIPAFARARAHRRAADLLAADGAPGDSVAAHLLLTRPDGDQQTVAALRGAAAQALTRGDPGAAAHLLARALAEPPDPAERGQVLLELANAEIEHGDAGAAGHIDEPVHCPVPGNGTAAVTVLVDVLPGIKEQRARHIIDFTGSPPSFASLDDLLERTARYSLRAAVGGAVGGHRAGAAGLGHAAGLGAR